MQASVCLIVNPAAGGGKAGRLAPAVELALRGHGLEVRRADTRDLAHARALGAEAARAGETVVALSGDGMIGALADALREIPGAVLGLLPGGRGNDLVRVLGISADAVEACATIAEGVARPIDLGIVSEDVSASPSAAGGPSAAGSSAPEGRAFVGIASAGFDSDANRIANEAPSWLGALVYAYGAVRALLSWRPARFEIELDPPGERVAFAAYSVGAANSKAYGGGMRAAPEALLDDGLLDVVAVESMPRMRFLTRILPKVFSGTHVSEPGVRSFRAREIRLSADRPFEMYADGDPIGQLPVRVRAARGAVTVLTPAAMAADSPFATEPLASAPERRATAHGQPRQPTA